MNDLAFDFSQIKSSVTFDVETTMDGQIMALMFGEGPRTADFKKMSLQMKSLECPVVVPRKRKGLTGKAYRSARRHYHRQMRAYERGLIPPVEFWRVFPNVVM